jgi:hypothetical protein
VTIVGGLAVTAAGKLAAVSVGGLVTVAVKAPAMVMFVHLSVLAAEK